MSIETKTTTKIIIVTGRVQGVGFRYFTLHQARAFGISGDVKNMPDGSVQIRANGKSSAMERFEAMIHHGPPGAIVKNVKTRTLCHDEKYDFVNNNGKFRVVT